VACLVAFWLSALIGGLLPFAARSALMHGRTLVVMLAFGAAGVVGAGRGARRSSRAAARDVVQAAEAAPKFADRTSL
jgi:hypothetical protein